MGYRNDLRNEKAPTKKHLFSVGWHTWEVSKIQETTFKSGNKGFIAELVDDEELKTIDVYMVSTEGKAWFLQQFLTAANAPQDKDGIFDWSEKDVIGKKILGYIEHEDNPWIDRQGVEHKDKQSKLLEFKALPNL